MQTTTATRRLEEMTIEELTNRLEQASDRIYWIPAVIGRSTIPTWVRMAHYRKLRQQIRLILADRMAL